jgi:dihydrofolate reductase
MADLRIEGYVIVSADGMLANADRVMPDELKFEGDKRFFDAALDRADLIVHGRHSQEEQPNTPKRQRVILTRAVSTLAPDPANPKATLWNPSGASFEQACAFAGVHSGTVAIIGGPDVFALFMDRYDTFWLSQAPGVRLPGGEPCFPGVPERSPQDILAAHGLQPGEARMLEPASSVSVTPWRRATKTQLPQERLPQDT